MIGGVLVKNTVNIEDLRKRGDLFYHNGNNQRMNISTYLFGFIIATLIGAIFHIWKDGGIGRLLMYLILSWIGFLVGHWVANSFGLKIMSLGSVNLAGGIIGSVALLFLGHWIGKVDQNILPKGRQ